MDFLKCYLGLAEKKITVNINFLFMMNKLS